MQAFGNTHARRRETRNHVSFWRMVGLAVSCIGLTSPAHAATQWGSYQWLTTPTNLPVLNNVNSSWAPYVNRATTDWSFTAASGFQMSMVLRSTAPVNPSTCKGPNGAVLVCNNRYGFNGWLGIAQIWTSGNYIQKGSVKLNDSYFNSASYNTAPWKNLVSCQEVAHTVGLGHDDTTFGDPNYGTCMDYTNSPTGGGSNGSLDNEFPNANDKALLECIYTSSTGCAAESAYLNTKTAASVADAGSSNMPTDFGIRNVGDPIPQDVDPGNSPATWGKAVAFTHDGRGRVYERDVGHGGKIITEVFWAPH